MADETHNTHRSKTQNYGPARGASQRIRALSFTGNSLCHIIIAIIFLNYKRTQTITAQTRLYGCITQSLEVFENRTDMRD